MHSVAGATGSSKVVATLRADGSVAMEAQSLNQQLSNLLNYEIRTEGELLLKKGSTHGPTTVVDLGKQLLQCARDSDVPGVKAALAHGAPFVSDWLGMSALHFAAMNNQLEICEILLQGGINMEAKTKVDRTPLHLACYFGHERIVNLLLTLRCAVNARDMLRMTPLHWAVEKKHKSIVRMLLKSHADVTLVSKFGKTPIALAVLTEQADILAELEAARQSQASRKFNEETEQRARNIKKETSEAVNSIMDESKSIRSLDDADMSVEDKMDVLETLRGHTNMLGNSALNMLKTHGIADMMQDNQIDDEASKKMLNTALRNGRQLVLSEGGRMLLHETNRGSNVKHSTNGSINNSLRNSAVSVQHPSINQTTLNSSPQKIRMNVIKQKESSSSASSSGGVTKNKNIRIISLTDFKKLCDQPKSLQKIPATLASSGVVRQLADGTKLVNMRQIQTRQLKLPSVPRSVDSSAIDDQQQVQNEVIVPSATHNPATTSTMRGQVGTVQTIQLRPSPAAGTAVGATNNGIVNKSSPNTTMRTNLRTGNEFNTTKGPNVMQLPTSTEICRQVHELRRHNEELRRRVDVMQKEKEDMLLRIERLEQLVLIRESDTEMKYVDI
ncbi:PREDICTED: tankyrase isoform X1 [Drosophila arizonae]|uniref:Tankyrase isoform X1 n=1 Tax=Drosophila arizonae TaxID=7263 RepID=A0ABM1NKU0_DROAR|nr:PREDICTED: tankyrase isoform X1 [Drosophila arizonae]